MPEIEKSGTEYGYWQQQPFTTTSPNIFYWQKAEQQLNN
jgi:hypothetical protein